MLVPGPPEVIENGHIRDSGTARLPDKETMATTEDARSESRIVVVGSQALQNELIVQYLQVNTGLACSSCTPADLTEMLKDEACQEGLFLVDSQDADLHVLLRAFNTEAQSSGRVFRVAACNMDPDLETDIEALGRGLQGVFYTTDPAGNVVKGVEAMLAGEKWFPRKTLHKYLREQRIGSGQRGVETAGMPLGSACGETVPGSHAPIEGGTGYGFHDELGLYNPEVDGDQSQS